MNPMTNPKHKKHLAISPQQLEELRRATLIASTGASTRLEGSKLSDKEVAQAANIVFGRKQEPQRS